MFRLQGEGRVADLTERSQDCIAYTCRLRREVAVVLQVWQGAEGSALLTPTGYIVSEDGVAGLTGCRRR